MKSLLLETTLKQVSCYSSEVRSLALIQRANTPLPRIPKTSYLPKTTYPSFKSTSFDYSYPIFSLSKITLIFNTS